MRRQSGSGAGVSMVLTVKNERRLLRDNLLFHRHLGVDHLFVYDDGGSDGSIASVADLPFVTPLRSVERNLYRDDPTCSEQIRSYDGIYSARQALNNRNALDLARERGDAWLIALDPDELICTDPHHLRPGTLAQELATTDPSVDQVAFVTAEIVQDRVAFDDVFAEAELFKLPDPRQLGYWTRAVAFLRHRLGFLHPLTRLAYDPDTGHEIRMGHIYGHTAGKSAVRLLPDVIPSDPHRFESRTKRDLNTVERGHLLHYYCCDFQDFVDSYRQIPNHPDRWLKRPRRLVEKQKRVWRDIVNHRGWSDKQLLEYFERWIMVSGPVSTRWLEMNPPAAMVVRSVGRVFAELRGTAESS